MFAHCIIYCKNRKKSMIFSKIFCFDLAGKFFQSKIDDFHLFSSDFRQKEAAFTAREKLLLGLGKRRIRAQCCTGVIVCQDPLIIVACLGVIVGAALAESHTVTVSVDMEGEGV